MSKNEYWNEKDYKYEYEYDILTKGLVCLKGAKYCVFNNTIFCSLFYIIGKFSLKFKTPSRQNKIQKIEMLISLNFVF